MAENGLKCSHPASSMDLYGHPTADRFFAYAQNDNRWCRPEQLPFRLKIAQPLDYQAVALVPRAGALTI